MYVMCVQTEGNSNVNPVTTRKRMKVVEVKIHGLQTSLGGVDPFHDLSVYKGTGKVVPVL